LAEVKYVEGWAILDDGRVLEHAWAEFAGGLFDNSDQHGDRVVGYFGALRADDPLRLALERRIDDSVPLCRDYLCKRDSGHFDEITAQDYASARKLAEGVAALVRKRIP